MLYTVANYHCTRLQGKLITRIWENGRKPSFRPDFAPFGPKCDLLKKNFRGFYLYWILYVVASLSAISRKTNEPNLRKWQKLRFEPDFSKPSPPPPTPFFFFPKNLAPLVTRYYGQLSSCTILKKTNDPILRKLSDGQTDGRTGQREWFQSMLSN